MKSIICSFLLLSTTLSLFHFSSTTVTSTNPIVLPTTTNHDFLLPEVLDSEGQPLKVGEEYTILSTLTGAGGVYLANIERTKCPDAVVEHILTPEDVGEPMPVKFFTYKQQLGGVVHEMEDINIMFSGPTSRPCVNETVWKAGYYILSLEHIPRFVVTGGNLGNLGPEGRDLRQLVQY